MCLSSSGTSAFYAINLCFHLAQNKKRQEKICVIKQANAISLYFFSLLLFFLHFKLLLVKDDDDAEDNDVDVDDDADADADDDDDWGEA